MSRITASTDPTLDAQRSEDVRFAASARAAAAERHHRPTYLLAIAGLILLCALAALAWSWRARSNAETTLANETALSAQFTEAANRLTQLQAAPRSGSGANEPISDMGTRLQNAARRAGMTSTALVPTQPSAGSRNPKSGNARRMTYTYNAVREPALEPLVAWMNAAVEDVPGLEVYSLLLKPEANGWMMNVTFTRWERTGS